MYNEKIINYLYCSVNCLHHFRTDRGFGKRFETTEEGFDAKLKELQIDLEKEKAGYDELTKEAAEANAAANSVTTFFSTSDASSTVKDAKATIKKLKEAKKINKKLAKSQKKLKKLQKKIDKTQESINKLDLVVKIHEN